MGATVSPKQRGRRETAPWVCLGLHDLSTCFTFLDETASTSRLSSTPFGCSHSTASALLCHFEISFLSGHPPVWMKDPHRALPPVEPTLSVDGRLVNSGTDAEELQLARQGRTARAVEQTGPSMRRYLMCCTSLFYPLVLSSHQSGLFIPLGAVTRLSPGCAIPAGSPLN